MITDLKAIKRLGKLRHEENDDFRMYVRELPFSIKAIDEAVETAYVEVSKKVDCTHCANCCRKLNPTLTMNDVKRLARHLGMPLKAFITRYLRLIQQDKKQVLIFQKRPCPFLKKNCCTVYEVRPRDCRSFPHLHRRGFVYRVRQAAENYDLCPIVFNTYEALKKSLARRVRPVTTCGLILISLMACACLATTNQLSAKPITLHPSDRVLVLAPHPDDEVLGCGGIIQRCMALNIPVQVVYFTYGDNNEWSFLIYRKHAVLAPGAVKIMGQIRHDEAVASAAAMGLGTNQLTFLGYPDFGTLHIWINHWGDAPPAVGMMTHATSVPYANALRPGAPYRGQEIVRDLTTVFRSFKPTKIFVSHPADFNVDHRALYCFTQLTLWNLENEMRPEVIPYLVHFPHWPEPRGEQSGLPLKPPDFFQNDIAWREFELSHDLIAGKEKALRAHQSQFEYASRYLESFMRTNELFGDFEKISLATPKFAAPHSRALLTQGAVHRQDERDEKDHLTESEQNGFVGLEWRYIQLETNAIKLSIALSRPLGDTVSATLQVFGYRHDVPFERMPKIRVEVGVLKHSVHDQNQSLPAKSVTVSHRKRDIEAEFPLELLGHPERLFVCARTYLGEIPLDWVSWRLVELK